MASHDRIISLYAAMQRARASYLAMPCSIRRVFIARAERELAHAMIDAGLSDVVDFPASGEMLADVLADIDAMQVSA